MRTNGMKKKLGPFLLAVSLLLGAVSCGHALKEIRIPNSQIDKAFDTAIEAGVSLEYNPTYVDREKGEIVLKKTRSTTTYKIIINFCKSPDTNNAIIRFKGGLAEYIARRAGEGLSTENEINIIATEIEDKLR